MDLYLPVLILIFAALIITALVTSEDPLGMKKKTKYRPRKAALKKTKKELDKIKKDTKSKRKVKKWQVINIW